MLPHAAPGWRGLLTDYRPATRRGRSNRAPSAPSRLLSAVLHAWGRKSWTSPMRSLTSGCACACAGPARNGSRWSPSRVAGLKVTLIDHRPAMMSPEQWPEVDCTLVRSRHDVAAAVGSVECDAAVIMNHHYERDLHFLAVWLGSEAPFIGMLGPRQRTEQMLAT